MDYKPNNCITQDLFSVSHSTSRKDLQKEEIW